MENFFPGKIMPAVSFENAAPALKVAQAIKDGGLNVLEIPLRTIEAFTAIKSIREKMPDMIVGAGTILTLSQLEQAKESGAHFGLAPGFNRSIVKAAADINFPFIPGVMTPSEIEMAIEYSCLTLKLFPVAQLGGFKMLKALLGPYKHTGVKFIPMGGVSLKNLRSYLEQENVLAVGGSWIADNKLIATEDYTAIRTNTIEAVKASMDNKDSNAL